MCTDSSSLDNIEEKRRLLEDLLYDFEDYTDVDTFEVERFTEVQAATKFLALNVIDIIKKTKLEAPVSKSPAYSAPSSSKFPPLPPLPAIIPVRSPSGSSSPALPIGRRPSIPGAKRADRSISPPPPPPPPLSVPPAVPGRSDRTARPGRSESSPASESPDLAVVHPLRLPPSKRTYDTLNMNSVRSQRSMVSNGTARSRISQVSAGSVESQPPPAYTASGEVMVPMPPIPQGEDNRLPTSRSSTPENLSAPQHGPPPPPRTASTPTGDNPQQISPITPSDTSVGNPVSFSAFPTPRPGHSNHGTRVTAWVSDQAEVAALPPSLRTSSRLEPHPLQSTQNIQSMTIPEGRAINMIRGQNGQKHSSINFDSHLTPMLSQLSNFSIDSSTVSSSASVDTRSSISPERLRMSPLSQATSISSIQHKPTPPLPLQTPDETIETRIAPSTPGSTLTPLILPAAALESQEIPSSPPARNLVTPAPSATTTDEWQAETRTVVSDHGSTIAGFSTHSGSQPSVGFPQPREPELAIGPRSSLYALSGFCNGATLFKSSQHQDGVLKLAGHVAGLSTSTARCESCSYGHAFSELHLDVNEKSPRATFPRPGGVLFRIRFLYKSHLVAQRPSEAFYGCLFCAQDGTVVNEGDATVFRSSDDLFRHLARHPQPLPEISGLTVLYGKEILTTDPRIGDFDLWLAEEPTPQPSRPLNLTQLPVATATRNHVQRYAEKKLPRPDGKRVDELLQFFIGARIIGVEYPRVYGGKWCTGFHDGEWGFFPAKSIELEKPRPGGLDAPPMQFQGGGGTSVTVVTRWKWDAVAAGGGTAGGLSEKGWWLGFEKGEKITNVGWPVVWEGVGGGRDAWCWSGTNSKGRFGVFPRSHVDEATLRDDARPLTAGGSGGGGFGGRRKKEGGKGSGKSLFGVRRRASIDSSRSGYSGGVVEII